MPYYLPSEEGFEREIRKIRAARGMVNDAPRHTEGESGTGRKDQQKQ